MLDVLGAQVFISGCFPIGMRLVDARHRFLASCDYGIMDFYIHKNHKIMV